MTPRFITRDIHALLDYPVALVLMTAPIALGLGESHPMARWLGVGSGIAAFVLTLLTDHKLGAIRILPYRFHLVADAGVGLLFLTVPFILSFSGLDQWFYLANGAAVMTVVSLHKPEPNPEPRIA